MESVRACWARRCDAQRQPDAPRQRVRPLDRWRSFAGATATLGNSAGLYWEQSGTLSNKTITLGSGAYIYINGVNNTLTLGPTTSVTGDVQIYSSGSAGSALINQGNLTHTGGSSSIYAPTFTPTRPGSQFR